MGGRHDPEIEAMVAEAAAETTHELLLGPWPEDLGLRIEAKVDKVLTNHLPHVEARLMHLEETFLSKQKWQFWTGMATFLAVLLVILIR